MGWWCWRWPFWWWGTEGVKLLFLVQVDATSVDRRTERARLTPDNQIYSCSEYWMQGDAEKLSVSRRSCWVEVHWWLTVMVRGGLAGGKTILLWAQPRPRGNLQQTIAAMASWENAIGLSWGERAACTRQHTQTMKHQGPVPRRQLNKFSDRISFELTKPNHSNLALLVPWCWSLSVFVNSGFDPEFVEHVLCVFSSCWDHKLFC